MEGSSVDGTSMEDLIFSLFDYSVLKISERIKILFPVIDWDQISCLGDYDLAAPLPEELGKRKDRYPSQSDSDATVEFGKGGTQVFAKEVAWVSGDGERLHLMLFPSNVERYFEISRRQLQEYMDRLGSPAVLFDHSLESTTAINYDMVSLMRKSISLFSNGIGLKDLLMDDSIFEKLLDWRESASVSQAFEVKVSSQDGRGHWFEVNFSKVKMEGLIYLMAVFKDIHEATVFQLRQRKKKLILSRLSKVQNSFLSKTSDFNPYQLFLDAILDISGAEYGFVGEVGVGSEGNKLMKIHAVTDFSNNSEASKALIDKLKHDKFFFSHFDNLFGACIKTGQVICENSPKTNPHSSNKRIPGHPTISNFLGIPILNGDQVVGLIGLGNKPEGFCENDVEDLQPFASTYSVILNALENEERNQVLLRDSSDKALILSTVGDHSPDTIVVLDGQLNINFLSPGYSKHFGAAVTELDAKNKIKSLIGKTLAHKYKQTEEHYRSRLCITTKEHENRWLETSLNIFGSEGGQKIIAFVREVTTHVKSELTLKASLRKERQFKHFLSEFMGVIAHEFKTPLATIISSLELSGVYLNQPTEDNLLMIKKHLAKMENEAGNLHRIVVNSLAYERFRKESATLKKEEVKLYSFLVDTLSQYGLADQVSLSCEMDPDFKVRWDRFLMQTTLVNLVNNALKYSDGKGMPKLSVRSRASGFSISVRDYGIGISEKDLPYIFTPFYRGTNSQHVEGTGMGLIAVKNFVKLHGGELRVRSKLNEGTLVTLLFKE